MKENSFQFCYVLLRLPSKLEAFETFRLSRNSGLFSFVLFRIFKLNVVGGYSKRRNMVLTRLLTFPRKLQILPPIQRTGGRPPADQWPRSNIEVLSMDHLVTCGTVT
jgi:hypothetical protein